jgi:hypothetical protein
MADEKRTRTDSQVSGMAGEVFVGGKLFKRHLQVSITLGNAKSLDLLAYNPKTKSNYNVQVKTVRIKTCFPVRGDDLEPKHIYVFVILNRDDQNEEFFILKGKTIIDNRDLFFGTSYTSNFQTINYGPLKQYKDNWILFDLEETI